MMPPAAQHDPEPTPVEALAEVPAPKAATESKASFRPMPVLTILSILCLGILYMLGDWQWTKFVEKSRAPAVIAATAPVSVAAGLQSPQPEYRPVELTGLIDPRSVKVRALRDGISGYRIFTPVVLEDGWIFVDRGFVAEIDGDKVPVLSGQISYRGVLRKGAKANSFTPDNDPIQQDWYWPDLPAMGASLKLTGGSPAYYVALNLVDPLATGQTQINPWADSKGANQIPPERHLGYALTWWGFGFALIGVYTGLHLRTGRLRFGRSPS
jgi:surfeit locus 1 family protein